MNWFLTTGVVAPADFPETVRSLVLSPEEREPTDEAVEQVAAAKAAALALYASGVVGTDHPIAATLVGHGSPGHQPTGTWTQDGVTVYLWQVTE